MHPWQVNSLNQGWTKWCVGLKEIVTDIRERPKLLLVEYAVLTTTILVLAQALRVDVRLRCGKQGVLSPQKA